ncbi:hypothetical protein FNU76_18910 [Chitinimonas arctica]|uniref:Uncharacterized protein n=1 Tax=Chitinimonas arctica TaxID=2594795 RepID=A0A516SJB1_9NEIS|nr:hypothetical protein [Chitinimonas arctica]QDQ28252.1 hypothetical protein FNU76_18910 [Chitinimonas arctica]
MAGKHRIYQTKDNIREKADAFFAYGIAALAGEARSVAQHAHWLFQCVSAYEHVAPVKCAACEMDSEALYFLFDSNRHDPQSENFQRLVEDLATQWLASREGANTD